MTATKGNSNLSTTSTYLAPSKLANENIPDDSSTSTHAPATVVAKSLTRLPANSSESQAIDSCDPERVPKVKYEDPYGFQDGVKSPEELRVLRKIGKKGKKMERYHRRQNELIEYLLKPMETHTSEALQEEEAARLSVKIAVWASLIANFALCVIQLYAAITSVSISLITTGIDSVFDIGSNIMLFWLHRKANNLDPAKWPVGGARLETIGNVVYGSLMSSVNLVVVVESVQTILDHKGGDTNKLHIPSLIAVAAALGVKFLLFLYCFGIRRSSSQVQILWEDHRNDLWINTFALLMSLGGSKLKWYLDPLGGLIIASGVIVSWVRTMHGQFEFLAGKSAPHEFLQLIAYKAMTFSEEIEKLDTVRAYYSGPDFYVEVDIVMPADTELWKAHDVAQRLQDQIELLPDVERAFVHVDHETQHPPEHRKGQ